MNISRRRFVAGGSTLLVSALLAQNAFAAGATKFIDDYATLYNADSDRYVIFRSRLSRNNATIEVKNSNFTVVDRLTNIIVNRGDLSQRDSVTGPYIVYVGPRTGDFSATNVATVTYRNAALYDGEFYDLHVDLESVDLVAQARNDSGVKRDGLLYDGEVSKGVAVLQLGVEGFYVLCLPQVNDFWSTMTEAKLGEKVGTTSTGVPYTWASSLAICCPAAEIGLRLRIDGPVASGLVHAFDLDQYDKHAWVPTPATPSYSKESYLVGDYNEQLGVDNDAVAYVKTQNFDVVESVNGSYTFYGAQGGNALNDLRTDFSSGVVFEYPDLSNCAAIWRGSDAQTYVGIGEVDYEGVVKLRKTASDTGIA